MRSIIGQVLNVETQWRVVTRVGLSKGLEMRSFAILLVAALASIVVGSAVSLAQVSSSGTAAGEKLSPAELLGLLRAGGYTIHFRHGATEFKSERDKRSLR